MKSMQCACIGLCFFAMVVAVAGCSGAGSHRSNSPEGLLEENACAIRCPADTGNMYAGLSGSVVCREAVAPACQCSDDSRPLAGCESLENQGTHE